MATDTPAPPGSYIKISGFPVTTQDADGIYTTTITYSDGSASVTSSGYNPPNLRLCIQTASLDLAQNYNQASLAAIGVTPVVVAE